MYNEETIQQVWEKGRIVAGYDSAIIRKDPCGAWIMRNDYGNTNSKFGWEIDHIYPESLGGDDNLLNLRPMHWENNKSKGDDYPVYQVAVQSDGADNITINTQYSINKDIQSKIRQLYNL